MCGEVAGRTYDCSHYLRSPLTVAGETLQLCADCFCAFRVDWMPDPAWSPDAEKLEKRIAEYAETVSDSRPQWAIDRPAYSDHTGECKHVNAIFGNAFTFDGWDCTCD